jgi:hypothetical protein
MGNPAIGVSFRLGEGCTWPAGEAFVVSAGGLQPVLLSL